MEKISAACAMDWSIELEKALRSKYPGKSVEAILKMGQRLVQWSREPLPTMAVYNMFGLIQGEDRLFAHTILLRLAEAFRLGDKSIRHAIVKMFLYHYRALYDKKKGKREYGVLSKARVHNQEELLRRVKVVFDAGDVEDRALSLVLFGCWADFAKDSASVRYVVLSSMVSSNNLEVKASLFSAGCFSESSEDFAYIVLEMLVNLITSSGTVLALRVAGAHVFERMQCSYAVVNKAYKAGVKLVLDSLEDEFLVPMLYSLSKVACRSATLISQQVDLLISFFTPEKSLNLQETVLRCLHFIFMKGVCRASAGASTFRILLSRLDEPELPTGMRCGILRTLQKVLYTLPNLPCGEETVEVGKLLTIVKAASQSPVILRNPSTIHALEDIICKLRGRVETLLPSQLVSLIIEHIDFLVKSLPCQTNYDVFQGVQNLLGMLLILVREYPDVGILVLDKIYIFVQSLANSGMPGSKVAKSSICIPSVVYSVYKFVVSLLKNLTEADAITIHVFNRVKILVESICQNSFFDCFTQTIYSLLLHSCVLWGCLSTEKGDGVNSGVYSHGFSLNNETFILDHAKALLGERNYWSAYRVGVHAACQGACFPASFIFEHLMRNVESDLQKCWLKSLVHLAYSDRRIQLIFTKYQSSLIMWFQQNNCDTAHLKDDLDEAAKDAAGNANLHYLGKTFRMACNHLCTSEETLSTDIKSDQAFHFQRWLLSVRAKVLATVVDVIKILSASLLNQERITPSGHFEQSSIEGHLKFVLEINTASFQFRRLAQELDLIATSFIDMSSRSHRKISTLSLVCSLLAFSTNFALFVPLVIHGTSLSSGDLGLSGDCMNAMLVQDLVGRLWHIDRETCMDLNLLLADSGLPKPCFHLQSRNQILRVDCELRRIVTLCHYAVKRVGHLHTEAKMVNKGEILYKVWKGGSQILLDIIMKWIDAPFEVPRYFYKVRPHIGSELFSFSADLKHQDGIRVLQGSHLSLNICLQLKNIPPDLSVRIKKLCCILRSGLSYQASESSGMDRRPHSKDCGDEDTIELSETLACYASPCLKRTSCKTGTCGGSSSGIANAFMSFKPNERGQGFSTCLLDVSRFPAGSYRIRWHSSCIDDKGSYWNLLSLNPGPAFTIQKPSGC